MGFIQKKESSTVEKLLYNPTMNKKLSPKQMRFLHGLAEGKNITTAYKDAGYNGETIQSAYALKQKLSNRLYEEISGRGFNSEKLAAEIVKFLNIPVNVPEKGMTLNERLKILRLMDKVLPKSEKASASFSRFQIFVNGNARIVHSDIGKRSLIDTSNNSEMIDNQVIIETNNKDNKEERHNKGIEGLD